MSRNLEKHFLHLFTWRESLFTTVYLQACFKSYLRKNPEWIKGWGRGKPSHPAEAKAGEKEHAFLHPATAEDYNLVRMVHQQQSTVLQTRYATRYADSLPHSSLPLPEFGWLLAIFRLLFHPNQQSKVARRHPS